MIEVRWAPPHLTTDQKVWALAGLSPREREREVTDSFLAGRLLLKALVTELTGEAAPVIEQTCADCGGPHGRPTVAGLWLSLSRCAVGVVAAAASVPVGIDVEPAGSDAVAGMSLAEWTRTEAVLKADGRGLRVDPGEVMFTGSTATLGGSRYVVQDLTLDAGLQVSVAAREARSGTASARTGRRVGSARIPLQVHGSRSW